MKPGAVIGITDIHTGTLAHCIQPFEYLDTGGIIARLSLHRRSALEALPRIILRLCNYQWGVTVFHVEHGYSVLSAKLKVLWVPLRICSSLTPLQDE
jgi:hypothetical protein